MPTIVGYPGQVDLLDLHRREPTVFPFLLQSGQGGATGNHDILFACPGRTLESGSGEFLVELDRWITNSDRLEPDPDIPFLGGWFVYLGYETAAEIEPGLRLPSNDPVPRALATYCGAAVIRQRDSGQTFIVAESDDVPELRNILDAPRARTQVGLASLPAAINEDPAELYLSGVERILDYIRSGDIYQANLSRRWLIESSVQLAGCDLFERLCQQNPAPFAALAAWTGLEIISASPERLFQLRGSRIGTRPIAGTHARDASTDELDRAALIGHPKERAEHIMLIDLERNDLGRVCRTGSVVVDELLSLETYATVHHIVSNVSGSLRDNVSPAQIIRAMFPGGTITGCPKVRCMEIIAELEARPRGAYTGSLGYISRCGSMDFNILIRTLVREDGRLRLDTGAGIVAQSDPQRELAETRAKAAGMLQIFDAS